MAHEGTLTVKDDQGREKSFPCGGGLDSYPDRDGGLRVRGVINVEGEALEAARDLLAEARDGSPGMAWYTGEVYSEDRRDIKRVSGMPVRIAGIDETGNVRVESDQPPEA